ncbi:MAG: DUF3107 domain-containing protein [Actinomycetes bacterium]|jgi:Protein of unknown function (DUF3107)
MGKKDKDSKTSIRVGISDSSQELHFETLLGHEKVVALANEAISGGTTLVLVDIKDRTILVPAGKISYIEIGDTSDQKVGFTSL